MKKNLLFPVERCLQGPVNYPVKCKFVALAFPRSSEAASARSLRSACRLPSVAPSSPDNLAPAKKYSSNCSSGSGGSGGSGGIGALYIGLSIVSILQQISASYI